MYPSVIGFDVQFHILEIAISSDEELSTWEEIATADGIPFAVEFGCDTVPLSLRAYHADKFPLQEFLGKVRITSPGVQFSWQMMEEAAVQSGWREEEMGGWDSHYFHITVAREPEFTSDPKRIVIARGNEAFGDGQHVTTELMLKALENAVQEKLPSSFLDFGAGTGILAIAAAKLGVRSVEAWEIDAVARDICQKNIALNCVSLVRLREAPPGDESYDLICCNIQPPLLTDLTDDLVACLKPGARLILSGFTRLDEGFVSRRFGSAGLELRNTLEQSQWLAQEWILEARPG
jgi:ribosomal protein L11 methylase PrmA